MWKIFKHKPHVHKWSPFITVFGDIDEKCSCGETRALYHH